MYSGSVAAVLLLFLILYRLKNHLKSEDSLWLQRAIKLTTPAVWVGALLSTFLTLDPLVTRFFLHPNNEVIVSVTRGQCTEKGAAHTTRSRDTVNNEMCFYSGGNPVLGHTTLQISTKKFNRPVALESKIQLTVLPYDSLLLGENAYYAITHID
jgi:hypothetical protein